MTPPDILEDAARLVHGDRGDAYGHPLENHECTASLWSAWLTRKLRRPVTLTAEDVCWFNILQKASREANSPKRDNLVDVAGYALNVEMITRRRAETAAP
jgi:hypothetical protein